MGGRYEDVNRVDVPHRRIVVHTDSFSIDCVPRSHILVIERTLLMAHVKYIKEAILNKVRPAAVMRLYNYMLHRHANDRDNKTLMVHRVIFGLVCKRPNIAPNSPKYFL